MAPQTGSIIFSEMGGSASISEVSLILGATEITTTKQAYDAVLRQYHLHKRASGPPISSNCTINVDLSFATKGDEANSRELRPSLPLLTPDDPGTDPKDIVEVRHWLRLHVTGTPVVGEEKVPAWWNTHPIVLQRSFHDTA